MSIELPIHILDEDEAVEGDDDDGQVHIDDFEFDDVPVAPQDADAIRPKRALYVTNDGDNKYGYHDETRCNGCKHFKRGRKTTLAHVHRMQGGMVERSLSDGGPELRVAVDIERLMEQRDARLFLLFKQRRKRQGVNTFAGILGDRQAHEQMMPECWG